jgi:NADH dehydrogenase/NADH:ubiquinone oxidoreductase subunit G
MRRYSAAEAASAVAIAGEAQMPVFVAGPEGAALAAKLAGQVAKAKLLSLAPGGNGRGLQQAGFLQAFAGEKAALYHVVAGELANVAPELLQQLAQGGKVIVMASFREPWDEVADIILPMPTTFEKSGTTVNADGQVAQVVAGVKTRAATTAEIIAGLVK